MNAVKAVLVALALLVLAAPGRAEYRTVLVQVKQENGKAAVTIHSDDKKDRRSAVSVDEAVKALGAMTGWGSGVGVYVASAEGVREEDLKRLHAAVKGNIWLSLMQARGEAPQRLRNHFLKDGKQ